MKWKLFIGLGMWLWSTVIIGQDNPLEIANEHLAAQRWAEAIPSYRTYLAANPKDSSAHFNLGLALYKSDQLDEGWASLERAESLRYSPFRVAYHQAKVKVLQQDNAAALELLAETANNGFPAFQQLATDADFTPLLGKEKFIAILTRVRHNALPCSADEKYHPLDFWLGEWDVYVNDQKIATSSITKGEGDCTLHENYLTLGGYTGRSMNYYDPTDSLYKQLWIDKNNGISKYRSVTSRPSYLLMETYDSPQLIRMAYQLDPEKDEVTQTLEQSTDAGKNWANVFTGVYKRQAGTRAPDKDLLTAEELIKRSQAWHDPEHKWSTWRDTLRIVEPRTRNLKRATVVVLDNTKQSFYFERAYGEDLITYRVHPNGCEFTVNGNANPIAAQREKHRLSCERGAGYQGFYTFLYGLPMSLNSSTWTASGLPQKLKLRGTTYWALYLTVEGAPFSDQWCLYFDLDTYALSAYEFLPAEDSNLEGDYLILHGTLEKGGVKFPRLRNWYARSNDAFLGSDVGF